MIKRFLSIICLLLCHSALGLEDKATQASIGQIEYMNAAAGIPETTVFSLAKDTRGFLWLGTVSPLVRYDGHQFKSFRNDAEGSEQIVLSAASQLHIDRQGNMWIGSWGDGLAVYDQDMNLLAHYRHEPANINSLPSDKIQTLFEDSLGNMWVGTGDGGIGFLAQGTEQFQRFSHEAELLTSLSHNRIWAFTENNQGIWIATSEGLNLSPVSPTGEFEKITIQTNAENLQEASQLFRSLHTDNAGRIWFGGQGIAGIIGQNKRLLHLLIAPDGSALSPISKITQDKQGNVLLATLRGIYQVEPNTLAFKPWSNGRDLVFLPAYDIRDILFDNNNIMWLATRFSGIIKVNLTPKPFTHIGSYLDANGEQNISKVTALHRDSKGHFWIASPEGILHMQNNVELPQLFFQSELLKSGDIHSIISDENDLLLGGGPGIYRLNLQSKTLTDASELLEKFKVKSIQRLLRDSRGRLWIGSIHDGAVLVHADGSQVHFHNESQHQISGNTILNLFEDKDGYIWIGTLSNGLNRVNPDDLSVEFINSSTGLADDLVNDLAQDKQGVFWLGTAESLQKIEANLTAGDRFGLGEGLANDNIKSILLDEQGFLWASSSKGLSRFNQKSFVNFTSPEDLTGTEYLPGVKTFCPKIGLAFGGINGFDLVSPSLLKFNQSAPNTAITNLWLDGKLSRWTEGQTLVLPAGTQEIHFEFSALDFQQPSQNQHKYRLLGFNDDWKDADAGRKAIYTNLNPGQYTFEALGSNNHNVWSDEPVKVSFYVSPFWWQTFWAKILLVLVILASIVLWSRFRTLRHDQQRIALEKEVSRRTDQLKTSNQDLADTLMELKQYQTQIVEEEKMAALGRMVAGIAHEINTPIGLGVTASTLLQHKVTEIRQVLANKQLTSKKLQAFLDESDESTNIIYRNLQRADELVRSFKEVATDQTSNEKRKFTMHNVIEEVVVSMRPQFKGLAHQIKVDCDPELSVHSTPGAISQVLINMITNSLRHGFEHKEDGLIEIAVSRQGSQCQLIYQDNGKGVDSEVAPMIFDPFVTTKRGQGGTGLGMHLVYNLVTQVLNGRIEMQNRPEQGVTFTISFPAG